MTRLAVRRESFGSVTVFWLERDEVLLRLRERARGLVAARPDVAGVYLFGSLAEGRAVPGSDADVLVLLTHSETRWLDRPLTLPQRPPLPSYALLAANSSRRSSSKGGASGAGRQIRRPVTSSGSVSAGRQRSTRRSSRSTIQYSGAPVSRLRDKRGRGRRPAPLAGGMFPAPGSRTAPRG